MVAPLNTSQGYIRPPGREITGLTRAQRDDPEAPAPQSATTQAPATTQASATTSVPAPLTTPDVPGITRAHHEEGEIPAARPRLEPLFSNEGLVRLAEVQDRGRILGPIAGVVGALAVSGTALGRGLGSHLPGTKNAASGSGRPPVDEPPARGGRRRRAAVALILAGLLGVIIIGFVPAAVLSLMPDNTGLSGSPGNSSNVALGFASTWPDGTSAPALTAAPTSNVVGDDPLALDAARPAGTPVATGTPKLPTTKPPVSTPNPLTPTPTPAPKPSPAPTRTPAPTPTPAPTRTPVPTPATNSVAFEAAGSVNGTHTATSSVLRRTNFTFILDGLGGASCSLSSTPFMAAPPAQTVPGAAPKVGSIFVTTWGSAWPRGTYTVTATCTLAGKPTATASETVYVR